MKNQKGFSVIKALIAVLIVAAIAYVGVKVGSLGFNYHRLKDEMRGVAKYKSMQTEDVIKKVVIDKAAGLGIDLWEEDVVVDMYPGEKIVIDVYYEKDLVLPFYTRRFQFNPVVEEPLK
jgi:hypothetical protein